MSSSSSSNDMEIDIVEPEEKNIVDISTDISCEAVSGPYLNHVIKFSRLLESRSAVLYSYLANNVFRKKEEIFSMYLTLPIVLSFTKDIYFIENALLQTFNAFSQGINIKSPERERDKQIELATALIKCNRGWNEQMKETETVSSMIDIQCVWNENGIDPFYIETVRSLMFLQQIMGVLDKGSFQEGSDYYINFITNKLSKISKTKDKKCGQKEPTQCEEDKDCVLRMSSTGKQACINFERFRTTKPGEKPSYYVLDDPYTGKQFVYYSLCISRVVSGFAGIFEQNDVGRDGSVKPNGKYTIVFPPFGGSSWKDKIGGIMTFYYNGYISNTRTEDGETVGIMLGMTNAIDSWYDTCSEILEKIPTDAHIYIVGCSLGGALANVAAFKLLQYGYKNIHMYGLGAPRIGDANMHKYMSECKLAPDSANYVRINNIIKDKDFYTQFDPVTKFPINTWSFLGLGGSHLRFVDNARIRIMEGGLTFNPVLNTFITQPDYDMIPFEQIRRLGYNPNKGIALGGDCEEQFGFVHSIGAYSANNFVGARDYEGDGNNYTDYYDRIINLNEERC